MNNDKLKELEESLQQHHLLGMGQIDAGIVSDLITAYRQMEKEKKEIDPVKFDKVIKSLDQVQLRNNDKLGEANTELLEALKQIHLKTQLPLKMSCWWALRDIETIADAVYNKHKGE